MRMHGKSQVLREQGKNEDAMRTSGRCVEYSAQHNRQYAQHKNSD